MTTRAQAGTGRHTRTTAHAHTRTHTHALTRTLHFFTSPARHYSRLISFLQLSTVNNSAIRPKLIFYFTFFKLFTPPISYLSLLIILPYTLFTSNLTKTKYNFNNLLLSVTRDPGVAQIQENI